MRHVTATDLAGVERSRTPGNPLASERKAPVRRRNCRAFHHFGLRDTRRGKYIYYDLNASVLEEILLWISELKGENHEKVE